MDAGPELSTDFASSEPSSTDSGWPRHDRSVAHQILCVRNRIDPGPALVALAAAQEGVVSREQALAHAMTVESVRRLLSQGWWQRLAGGLYYCGTETPSWPALAWGGVLLGGEESRLGGEAAAHLHGLIDAPPDVIIVLVGHGRRHVPRGPWQFVQERSGVRRGSRGAPPRIDVEDCVLDLCDDADPASVVDLVSRAVQTRKTTSGRLIRRLDDRPRHSQRRLLQELLTDVDDGAESPLELRYLNEVERPHGLPRGVRQHRDRGRHRMSITGSSSRSSSWTASMAIKDAIDIET